MNIDSPLNRSEGSLPGDPGGDARGNGCCQFLENITNVALAALELFKKALAFLFPCCFPKHIHVSPLPSQRDNVTNSVEEEPDLGLRALPLEDRTVQLREAIVALPPLSEDNLSSREYHNTLRRANSISDISLTGTWSQEAPPPPSPRDNVTNSVEEATDFGLRALFSGDSLSSREYHNTLRRANSVSDISLPGTRSQEAPPASDTSFEDAVSEDPQVPELQNPPGKPRDNLSLRQYQPSVTLEASMIGLRQEPRKFGDRGINALAGSQIHSRELPDQDEGGSENARGVLSAICEGHWNRYASGDIDEIIAYWEEIAQSNLGKGQLQKFFLELIPQYEATKGEQVFNRGYLRGRVELQRLLSPGLDELLKQQEETEALKDDSGHQLNIAWEKAQLGLKLGVAPIPTGAGANGALFLLDPFEDSDLQAVAVYKAPPKLEWSFEGITNTLIRLFKQEFVGQARLCNRNGDAEQFSEAAVPELCNILDINIAPPAMMKKIEWEEHGETKSLEGAFIFFLDGYAPMSKFPDLRSKKVEDYTQEEKNKYHQMSGAQWALGNVDLHGDNIFIMRAQDGTILDVMGIDFGNALKENNAGGNLGEWGLMGNARAFADWPIAQCPFSQEVKNEIVEKYTNEAIDSWLEKLESMGRRDFATGDMEKLLRQRFMILREGVKKEEINSPVDLARIQTSQKHFEALDRIDPSGKWREILAQYSPRGEGHY